MDNASHHSRRTEQLPTTAWRKGQIKDWLEERNIEHDDSLLKAELLTLARQHFPAFKKYVVDEMAKARGMEVIRLPPYHCELNPIELIWAQIKGKVARENTTFKLADVKKTSQWCNQRSKCRQLDKMYRPCEESEIQNVGSRYYNGYSGYSR